MRFWIVNHYAKSPSDPGAVRHFSMGRALAAQGHDVHIFASAFDHVTGRDDRSDAEQTETVETIDGVSFHWLRTPPYRGNGARRLWNMLVFAWRMVRRRTSPEARPDVIIGSSPHLFAGVAAWWLAQRVGARCLLEVRDLWPLSFKEVLGMSVWHPLYVLLAGLERFLYRRCDGVITLLPAAVDHIAARGAERERIMWIPNGIDLRLLPSEPEDAAASPTLTVMYAGAHGVINALDTIVDAADELDRRGLSERLKFVLLGDGPEKPRLQQKAQLLNLANIDFQAPVAKQDIYTHLAQADLFVVSLLRRSLYRHGISLNKLYDYMAMGRPTVFGCDASNNPIDEAAAGTTVAPEDPLAMADAIATYLELSAAERHAIGQRGFVHVREHYSYAALATRLVDFVNSFAAGGKTS